MGSIHLKRIYDDYAETDGYRVLVDRLWPRGVSKEKAQVDYWPKELTPSKSLRQSLHNDELDWESFKKAYRDELEQDDHVDEAVRHLSEQLNHGDVTLLFASKNTTVNHAQVLKG
ncbi:uncharacterized protein YeaO (DUF488 family) [Alkalibacillus flavidus]|uniref:Uncharacterized protein YeaO (DUF488 family) n=1 Tax=Alkalibacillus flavidus TaxID=546021 RepID=A0ABV2KX99_9BACI